MYEHINPYVTVFSKLCMIAVANVAYVAPRSHAWNPLD